MRYIVKGYAKKTRKLQESNICSNYRQCLAEAQIYLKSNAYEVITICADDEGESHPDNAGKFFVFKIIK